MTNISTADLCDAHANEIHILHPGLHRFGDRPACAGPIRTVRCFEDNSRVRELVQQPGGGAVLVVDGAGSYGCALMGDKLAGWAVDNGWAGIVINGCIRDSQEINGLPLAVRALATHPLASRKEGRGEADVPVSFLGVRFVPGAWLAMDEDGLIVAERPLDK